MYQLATIGTPVSVGQGSVVMFLGGLGVAHASYQVLRSDRLWQRRCWSVR
jgi:hypothetical protein